MSGPGAPTPANRSRRRLLGAGLAVGAIGMGRFGQLLAAAAGPARSTAGYGPLRAVRDETTGLALLELPAGFRYITFGWTGERLADGSPTPAQHDGMGVVRQQADRITLIRNHEVKSAQGAFGPKGARYDSNCGGGTVTMLFDGAQGALVEARPSLSGTLWNCAGGVTPWGTWLTCEETVVEPGMRATLEYGAGQINRAHGFVFEVPADGVADATPLQGLGQFRHEAAAVDPVSGAVFLTEDADPQAGFYRFLPDHPGRLADGGRLEMLRVEDLSDLRGGLRRDREWKCDFVPIPEPAAGVRELRGDGVFQQGLAAGGSRFTRLEGCHAADGRIYFTSTNGGAHRSGQVFAFNPSAMTLSLVAESAGGRFRFPDNLCASRGGTLVVCEDSGERGQALHGVTLDGRTFEFARNTVVLDGQSAAQGLRGDFRGSEWAGCTFSDDGKWLFANLQSPGLSVAITGPWADGPF